jgi:NAD(P)-dependent dehydrogenase (short-subunit alcohol dehydrogenase family)
MERFGALDIMGVNDAAGIHARATEMTEDVWRRVMEVDLTGCFNCAQVASIGMIEQGRGGSIVMVSAN